MNTSTCERCGGELRIGDYPFCKGDPTAHAPMRGAVIPDDIPGGVLIEHGICNEDGSPRRYYSKSEMAAEAKRRGLVNMVRHVPDSRDSDKSAQTTRWV
jgi:hypothetical protein